MAMSSAAAALDVILLVDDEEPVRRTFREWLESANLGCRVLAASDAESALVLANEHKIDLAILDWNLGAGNDGLRLLEDLCVFHPDIVAILATGFAHQATPLDAMRMGVRDYLDKNQDLNRESFLAAVRRQLERLRPTKRERQLHESLLAFQQAVREALPLAQSADALRDPVPVSAAARSLLRFLRTATGAAEAILVSRSYDPRRELSESYRAHGLDGEPIVEELVPWSQCLAAAACGNSESSIARLDGSDGATAFPLQPFERGRRQVLAAVLLNEPGIQAVLELFDKQTSGAAASFSPEDRRLVESASQFGGELLRHALAERETQRLLVDALESALRAGESVAESLRGKPASESAPALMDTIREGLRASMAPEEGVDWLPLAESIRQLTQRHGSLAVEPCRRLIDTVRDLLDRATGS